MYFSPECFVILALICLLFTGLGLVSESVLLGLVVIGSLFLPKAQGVLLISGFKSSSIYLLICVMAISTILQNSILIKRWILHGLVRFADHPKLLKHVLFFFGVFLTSVLSAQSTRIAIMAPILDKILTNTAGLMKREAVNAITNAAFNGCILLSTIFLSGKSSNYVLFSMLTTKQALPNGWLTWLTFASFPGLLLIIAFYVIHALNFRSNIFSPLNRFSLIKEIINLGDNCYIENTALLMFATLIVGLVLVWLLNLPIVLLCLIVVITPILTGVIEPQGITQLINWNLIGYLVAIIGLMNYMENIDISIYHLDKLSLINSLCQNPIDCLFVIFIISWLINLVFGTIIAPSLAFTLIYPFIQNSSIHLWIVAFVILLATESWIFPYQSSYYMCFKKIMHQNQQFTSAPLLKMNACFALVKLLIIFVSIPFWQFLGIL